MFNRLTYFGKCLVENLDLLIEEFRYLNLNYSYKYLVRLFAHYFPIFMYVLVVHLQKIHLLLCDRDYFVNHLRICDRIPFVVHTSSFSLLSLVARQTLKQQNGRRYKDKVLHQSCKANFAECNFYMPGKKYELAHSLTISNPT